MNERTKRAARIVLGGRAVAAAALALGVFAGCTAREPLDAKALMMARGAKAAEEAAQDRTDQMIRQVMEAEEDRAASTPSRAQRGWIRLNNDRAERERDAWLRSQW